MRRYPLNLICAIQGLRSRGETYGDIRKKLNINVPKSSLSHICRDVKLPKEYEARIQRLNVTNLRKGRKIAVEMNKIKREQLFHEITERNLPISRNIHELVTGKIALAMLCLGEASKYNPKKTRSFSLGSSDFRIINIFLLLLKNCFPFNSEKIRATVQCRADQSPNDLQKYWEDHTGIPVRLFYKPQIDPRTKGKPTRKRDYHGVLRVDYFDTRAQLELESLADLVYNQLHSRGPVVYR